MIEAAYITGFLTGVKVGKNIVPGGEPGTNPTFDSNVEKFDSNEFTFDNETT